MQCTEIENLGNATGGGLAYQTPNVCKQNSGGNYSGFAEANYINFQVCI